MNKVIDNIYATGECVAPDGVRYPVFPAAIKRNQGEALYALVTRLDARQTLEIGMAWGLSSLFICQAHRDLGHAAPAHTAIDPFQTKGFHAMALHNLRSAGLFDLLTFIEESSHTAMPRLVFDNQKFDLIFIDGAHLFDDALVDFFFADQLIPVGGHLIFDDLWMPAVRKVLGFVLSNRHYRIAEDLLPPIADLESARAQDAAYRQKKKREGKDDKGTRPESDFHLYRNINWTVLEKTDADLREWNHFIAF